MASPVFIGLSIAILLTATVQAQLLTPTIVNVAEGKPITATATCGENFPPPGELYCKLTGNTGDTLRQSERDIIQGQYCDYCDPQNPLKAHPIRYAIDGTEKWWQSPPLSRGTDYNGVNITIDLGQLYHIAYVLIKFANSPRPGVWILERSMDFGQTYQPWQYFAETKGECNQFFGMESIERITMDDDIICTDEYSSIVPLEDGEVVVSLVNDRPGAGNFSFSEALQEWTKATNIRIRLLRTNTLLGHLMAIARRDNTVTRRYFYSIKDISIGGRCVCNGHASTCDKRGLSGRRVCACEHNTCGEECEICCPGFVQKAWKPATIDNANECERCNCFRHSNVCYFNQTVVDQRLSIDNYGNYEGGGVCQDCQHNTMGINCEQCAPGYFRSAGVALDSPNVCEPCNCDLGFSTGSCFPITGECECLPQYSGPGCSLCSEGYYAYPTCKPCDCHINGTRDKICHVNGGQCPCKQSYTGRDCDRCALGSYNFPDCIPCECDQVGAFDTTCEPVSGQCTCREVYSERACDECRTGFFNFPACQNCICSPLGSTEDICDKTNGRCLCRENFSGTRCDRCSFGNFNYPDCQACNCDSRGSASNSCYDSGQCQCLPNFTGLKCESCAAGYYRYPDCLACECRRQGSLSIMCDQTSGQCSCRSSFRGRMCEQCAEGFYNFPACEECNCDPAGVVDVPGQPLGGCGSATGGACRCKGTVEGRTCDTCRVSYWNLQISNPEGCQDCSCNPSGTVNGMSECDMRSGQCLCKALVDGRMCSECRDGTFDLKQEDPLGCQDCGCDIGGSSHSACDKTTGQCVCKARVTGIMCNEPLPTHFYPDLFQHKFEIEGGSTPEGHRLRVGFDEDEFPGFSYLAYAVMSAIQPIVLREVEVTTPSLYHLVLHYVYRGETNVRGQLTITPSHPSLGSEQSSAILFVAGPDPQLVTVEGGGVISPFVLNPGSWTVTLEAPAGVLLDYLVLMPSAFYEATILQQKVSEPCIAGLPQERCNYYIYPNEDYFVVTRGVTGYYEIDGSNVPATQFTDQNLLMEVGVRDLAVLDVQHSTLLWNMPISETGDYIFVVEYYGGGPGIQTGTFSLSLPGTDQQGYFTFYDCKFLCRTVVVDSEGMPFIFDVNQFSPYVTLILDGNPDLIGISQVIAIPAARFTHDLVTPALQCVRTADGECQGSTYPVPPGAVWIDSSITDATAPLPPNVIDPDITLHYITTEGSGPTSVAYEDVDSLEGQYVFVVHYFQPGGGSINVEFNNMGEIDGEGSFQADYCPHVSGCRTVVMRPDGSSTFDLTGVGQGYYVTLPNYEDGDIWIDYVIAVPDSVFTPELLLEDPQDRAGEFIRNCGENSFNVGPDGSMFCRQATFSLTTDYNNGAIPCECNHQGSQSFNCETIGGQCHCRPNVAGRQCNRCKIGFYNFPSCQRCSCRSGVCNEITGECICPDNVFGDQCDQCNSRTYGYDPLVGCAECNCDGRGIVGGDYNCDVVSGQCRCKSNVGGRQCDQCVPGHHRYPFCDSCFCDVSGTEPSICDQSTALCQCKENVIGDQCSQCKPGSFYLEPGNTKGCISCFCFGHTAECRSYGRPRERFVDMEGWSVTNLKSPLLRSAGTLVNVHVGSVGTGTDPNLAVYWEAPDSYLGNKLTSYRGKLEFVVSNNVQRDSGVSTPTPIRRPDVTISGNNITIMYSNVERPQNGDRLEVSVELLESNFQYSFSGRTVTREDLMLVLAGITSLQIRAQYFSKFLDASLSDVSLEVARKDGGGSPAFEVEKCRCPLGYSGHSCESCSSGFYRSHSGPYLGTCEPCRCNGHSETCDVETGRCYNCQDNTEGDGCQLCKVGYFGDATTGLRDSCTICACPYPDETRNYAFTCIIVPAGMECDCLLGHTGARCDQCEEGYFGDPSQPYGYCRKCDCNGNTNPLGGGLECDSRFGNCLQCMPGTSGPSCDSCADWYHGDAIQSKNCRQCSCDRCGSDECSVDTGRCRCKPNVVGADCDRCAPGTWNITSCAGCSPCNCAFASENGQCDFETGQCQCKSGVGGAKCDRCLHGHWNYGFDGCQSCLCESHLRCDAATGECLCPPGATGDNCEFCEERYVMTDEGCQPCDECVTLLLDMMTALDFNISEAIANLSVISISYETYQRLNRLNESVLDAKDSLTALKDSNGQISSQLDNFEEDYGDLLNQVIQLSFNSSSTLQTGKEMKKESSDTLYRAVTLEGKINETLRAVYDAVQTLYNNSDIDPNDDTTDISAMLELARQIVGEIAERNFMYPEAFANNELNKSLDVLNRVKLLLNASLELMGHIQNVSNHDDDLKAKLEMLIDTSNAANNLSALAQELNDANKVPAFEAVLAEVEGLFNGATKDMQNATALIDAANLLLQDAKDAVKATELNSTLLDEAVRKLEPRVLFVVNRSDSVNDVVGEAQAHAANLKNQSDYLESLLVSTKNLSNNALQAAKAYGDIVDAINDAEAAANAAMNASTQADDKANSFGNEPAESLKKSRRLVRKASAANADLEELQPELEIVGQSVDDVKQRLDDTDGRLAAIRLAMASIPEEDSDCDINVCQAGGDGECKPGFIGEDCNIGTHGQQAQNAVDTAMAANAKANKAKATIDDIADQLPRLTEKVAQVPIDLEAGRRAAIIADSAIRTARNHVSAIRALDRTLTAVHANIENRTLGLDYNIEEIKRKIASARSLADGVKVAMKFRADSAVELRPIPSDLLEGQAAFSSASLVFRTQERDAMLYFVGGPTADDDYYSLGVENGNVVLRYNLGDGDNEVIVSKNVNDYTWHEVISERNGKYAKLIVKGLGQEDVLNDGVTIGDNTILDLSGDARAFVGGIPPAVEWLPDSIPNRFFQGGIDDVTVGGRPMSLWNFEQGINANQGILRNDTIDIPDDPEAEGIMFHGDGYIMLPSMGFNPRRPLTMSFKTWALDGLLFFIGAKGTYFSLGLVRGRIQFQYDLGSGPLTLTTDKMYNDGEVTTVQASISGKAGSLRVRPVNSVQEQLTGTSPGSGDTLQITDRFYIGGLVGIPQHMFPSVSRIGFHGCLRELVISIETIDPLKNLGSSGIFPGCSPEVVTLVSFDGPSGGYLSHAPINFNGDADLILRFRTELPNGVMVYTSNADKSQFLSIMMSEGVVVVVADSGNDLIELASAGERYDDGQWHVVSLTKNGKRLALTIDDLDTNSKRFQKKSLQTDEVLLIGGFPSSDFVEAAILPTTDNFIGCLADLAVGFQVVSFGDHLRALVNANLNVCPIGSSRPTNPTPNITEPVLPDGTVPPLTTPPMTTPSGSCALPRVAGEGEQQPEDVGAQQFGITESSRVEYPKLDPKYKLDLDMQIEMKTVAYNGLIILASDGRNIDFTALYIRDGFLVFGWDYGSGPKLIESPEQVNDGEWHTIGANREGALGELFIDGKLVRKDEIAGDNRYLRTNTPIFMGGVDPEVAPTLKENKINLASRVSFVGCLRGFLLDGQPPGIAELTVDVDPCRAIIEPGVFFGDNGGYLVQTSSYTVGSNFEMRMSIKPRVQTGILLSVQKVREDFLSLEMVDGAIYIRCENGDGPIEAVYVPGEGATFLCDGNWHDILVVKNRNLLSISVDGEEGTPGVGSEKAIAADTNDPLYIGGLPDGVVHSGITTTENFVGCIRDVMLGENLVNFKEVVSTVGDVNTMSCPAQ